MAGSLEELLKKADVCPSEAIEPEDGQQQENERGERPDPPAPRPGRLRFTTGRGRSRHSRDAGYSDDSKLALALLVWRDNGLSLLSRAERTAAGASQRIG